MASPAYQNNGAIIICGMKPKAVTALTGRFRDRDFTAGQGQCLRQSVPLSHSSDIKTMEEIFGLPRSIIRFQRLRPMSSAVTTICEPSMT